MALATVAETALAASSLRALASRRVERVAHAPLVILSFLTQPH